MNRVSPKLVLQKLVLSPLFVLYVAAAYVMVVIPIRPEIASPRNLVDVALGATPLIALALGQTFVVVTGGIDLSQTSLVAVASVIGASVMAGSEGLGDGGRIVAGVVAILLVTLAVGTVHGVSVSILRMPAFLVTLISMMFLQGLATLVSRSEPITGLPETLIDFTYAQWWRVPLPVLTIAGMALLAHAVLGHTVLGRRLIAVGQNIETARVSGVPIVSTMLAAYVLSTMFAGMGTLLYMSRLEVGKPDLVPAAFLLDCIGAVVIGGTSLMGGRGTMLGTVLGALFITLVSNSLYLFGNLQIWHVLLVKGFVFLLAAALEALRVRLTLRAEVQP